MNERKRFAYLDIVKLIAMISVCLYHFPLIGSTAYSDPLTAQTLVNRFFRGMNAVCVPLFMMVNGALLLNAGFDFRKHLLRTVKLFIGVYVWYVITQVIGHWARDGFAYVAEYIGSMAYSALYLYEYDGMALSHLWFVQMLVAVYVLLPLIRAAMDTQDRQLRLGFAGFIGAMTLLCVAVHDFDHVKSVLPVLWYLDLSCLETMNPIRGIYGAMIVYFVLGGVLHRRLDKLKKVPVWADVLLVVGGALALFIEWLAMTKKTEALYDIVYYGYNCIPTMCMAVGIFALAARGAEHLPETGRRAASLVGRNTLAIYYTHWIQGLVFLEGAAVPGSFLVNMIKALAMVIIGVLLGEGFRRLPVLRHLV